MTKKMKQFHILPHRWKPSGFSRRDRKVSKSTQVDRPIDRFLTGPVDRFFTKGFCLLFNVSNKNFSKGGGGMGEVLKFVTPDGGLRK